MGGIGSYYNNQMQQAQSAMPDNMQGVPEGTGGFKGQPGGMGMGYQQGGGYAATPGFGYHGGMPGRFGQSHMPSYGMSNYGFGGSPFGYGGFSPWGYGPGSYSPYGAGSMGYGGGMGMYGGPARPMTGFGMGMGRDYNQMAGGLAGNPGGEYQQFEWGNAITSQYMNQLNQLQKQLAKLQSNIRRGPSYDRGGGGRNGHGGMGSPQGGGDDSSGGSVGGVGGDSSGGDGSGCFAAGTLFEMADGSFKAVEQIEVGDKMRGGTVTRARNGPSTNEWYNYLGTDVTDEHFVFEDGAWKYVMDSLHAYRIPSQEYYYTLDNTEHRLYAPGDVMFTDDAVFDDNHPLHDLPYEKATWDLMLDELNDERSAAA